MGNSSRKRGQLDKRASSQQAFRMCDKDWVSFEDVARSDLDSMARASTDAVDLMSEIDRGTVKAIGKAVGSVRSWVGFAQIFADYDDFLSHIPLPPQRLPTDEQADADAQRELFAIFTPTKNSKVMTKQVRNLKASRARILEESRRQQERESAGGESARSEGQRSRSGSRATSTESVNATVVRSKGDSMADTPRRKTEMRSGEKLWRCSSSLVWDDAAMILHSLLPTILGDAVKTPLDETVAVIKRAASRTLGGGDSYFLCQQLFSGAELLVTPSHSELPGDIEIHLFENGVVSIHTWSIFDIRSVRRMDGKEMVQVRAVHILHLRPGEKLMKRQLLIESPDSQLAADMTELMGL